LSRSLLIIFALDPEISNSKIQNQIRKKKKKIFLKANRADEGAGMAVGRSEKHKNRFHKIKKFREKERGGGPRCRPCDLITEIRRRRTSVRGERGLQIPAAVGSVVL
jgi:hypothetical protein